MKTGKLKKNLPDRFSNTGLIFILEVHDDGSPGDYFLVQNFDNGNECDESFWPMINNDFTLAKLLQKPSATEDTAFDELYAQDIALEVLSVQGLQIVETGTRENNSKGIAPIPLYPLESSES